MSRHAARILQGIAVIVLVDIAALYTYTLRTQGEYPPSHPWPAIALGSVAVSYILRGRGRGRLDPPDRSQYVGAVLMLVAAGLWTVAALLRS